MSAVDSVLQSPPLRVLSIVVYHVPSQIGYIQMVSASLNTRSKAWNSIGFSDFQTLPTISNWLNVAGMVCSLSLLLSFVVLPVERTSRHYLTVGLVLAVSILQVSNWKQDQPWYKADCFTAWFYNTFRSPTSTVLRCHHT